MSVYYEVYSDGAARGNPDGRGGYGTIVIKYNDDDEIVYKEEFAEKFDPTTNNRMEILGAIIGIENVPNDSVIEVTSDSKYLVNAIQLKWLDNWVSNGWKTSTQQPVKNQDLWERMLIQLKIKQITFKWVKAHNGNPLNERCDLLATSIADGKKMVKKDGIYIISSDE